jgi:hypothetical protein
MPRIRVENRRERPSSRKAMFSPSVGIQSAWWRKTCPSKMRGARKATVAKATAGNSAVTAAQALRPQRATIDVAITPCEQ